MNVLNPAGLDVNIAGNIWWGGFTAEVTITNTTGRDLDAWSYTFDSPHQLNSAPWGAQQDWCGIMPNNFSRRFSVANKQLGPVQNLCDDLPQQTSRSTESYSLCA